MNPYEAADAIKAAPGLRRLSGAWCPRCSKLIAAVVAFQGEPWLWRLGGRSGSHRAFIAELEYNRDDFTAEAERRRVGGHDPTPALDALATAERLLEMARAGRVAAVTPGMAQPTADLRLPMTTAMACRGCRRDVSVTVGADLTFSVAWK